MGEGGRVAQKHRAWITRSKTFYKEVVKGVYTVLYSVMRFLY